MDDHDLRLVLVELTGEVKGLKESMNLKLDNMLTLINTGDARNAQMSEALRGSLDAVSKKADENSRRIESLELSRAELARTAATVEAQSGVIDSLKISRAKFAGALAVLGFASSALGLAVGHFTIH